MVINQCPIICPNFLISPHRHAMRELQHFNSEGFPYKMVERKDICIFKNSSGSQDC